MGRRFIFVISLLIFFSGCAAPASAPEPTATRAPPTSTPIPPTSTPRPSCEGASVEESCFELTFDGESCTYKGPPVLAPGPARLFFHNNSEEVAAVHFMKLMEGRTSEDMFRHFRGKESKAVHAPSWTRDLGTYNTLLGPGTTEEWGRILVPGNYHMCCVRTGNYRAWLGDGFTVEE